MFKTQAEMIKALFDGSRIKYAAWPLGDFVEIKDGFIINERGLPVNISFSLPHEWSIVEKPKPPRKLYAYRGNYEQVVFFSSEVDTTAWSRAPMFDITYKDE